jgi:CBS domain-containing protein
MQIQDIMTRDVEVIPPEATLQEAAQKMKNRDIGALPVCENGRLKGMLTDRDITVVATALGMNPSQTAAGDIMSPEVLYCYGDEEVESAASLMEEKQVRRLPILDRDKRLIGIVSLGDVAKKTQDTLLSGQVLEKVSEPAPETPTETRL